MKKPPRSQSSSSWQPLVVVLLVLAGAVWWALQPGEGAGGSEDRKGALTAGSAASRSVDQRESSRESKGDARADAKPEPAEIVEPPSSLQRGENEVLVYERPRQVKREVVAGKVFGEKILQVRDHEVRGPLTLDKHTASAVEAAYDPAVVERFLDSAAEAIRLPVDGQRTELVKVERVLSRGPVTHTLIGKVHHDPFSDVLLVFHDGAVSGSVAFYNVNDHYQYAMAGNGDIAIRRLDVSTYPERCGNPGDAPQAGAMADQAGAPPEPVELPEAPMSEDEPVAESDGPAASVILDTVVGYGQQARIAAGGTAAMESVIMQSVDRMNTAFTNSQVADTETVLLGTVEDPSYVFPGAVNGSMSSDDELGGLSDTGDGSLDTVSNLRIALGADQNTFVVKEADGSAGIAWTPGQDMIVARDYMTSNRITFAHEFGHNIGARHAWADTDNAFHLDLTKHYYGWRLDPPSSTRVRTIMAYDWDWGNGVRIPYYSNPTVQYNGANTGAVDGYDVTGDSTADARMLDGGWQGYGGAGEGYDGNNASLGARNADYIEDQAPFVADNAIRPAPEIAVEQPAGSGLTDGASSVAFNVPTLGGSDMKTFTIRNVGDLDLTGLVVTKDGSHAGEFTVGALGATTLAPSASTTFTVTFTPVAMGSRSAALHIASNDDDENPFDIDLSGGNRTEIYSESFESGMGGWLNSTGLDFNWTRHTGGTGSSSTGPDGATDGSYYIYTESSSPNYPSKTAGLERTFDFSGFSDLVLNFAYHMHGDSMGSLSVDVYDGTWHNDYWTRAGEQHSDETDSWSSAAVDLSEFDNQSGVIVRFRGVTGDLYRSDMAVDAISIFGALANYTLSYTAGPGGTLSGATSQSVPAGGDGTAVSADANTNYHFVDWSDGSTANPRTDTNVSANISVTANFAIDTYTVTFEEGAHGAITAGQAVQDVDHGSAAVAPTITADPGWNFTGWDVAFDNVTGPLTVTAQYSQIMHQLSVASVHGTPNPAVGDHDYNWGTELTATVTSPDVQGTTRYVCSGWTGTGSVPASGSGTSTTFTLTETSSITWNWGTEYQLDVETSGNGAIDVGDGWHASGSQVVLTATANAGNHFTGWTGDTGTIVVGDAMSPQITVQLDAPVAVTAGFANGIKYDDWAAAAGLTGNDALLSASPFDDGVSNFHKYAFNLNAGGSDGRMLMPGTGTAGLPVATLDESGPSPVIRLEFLQRKIAGLTYTPQQNTTLNGGSWVPMTGTVTPTTIDAEWDRVVVEHPETLAWEFFRVRVTMD